MKKQILCSISTRGRYDTTLSNAVQAVALQTMKPDKLVIFDDNDQPQDLREIQRFRYLFNILDIKGIQWEVIYGAKKGQHHNHQIANRMGYQWVWRVDDDCVPEPNVLDILLNHVNDLFGAVGGSILTPPFSTVPDTTTGSIQRLNDEPNLQWDYIRAVKSVDHLHCSFLYRAGIVDYNLNLSRAAFREETLFTYQLRRQGYEILVVPDAVTWHLKNSQGGIRTEQAEMFHRDEHIFRNYLKYQDRTIVVLDNGLGDHLVFRRVLPEIRNPIIFSCYPEIVPGGSIAEAHELFGDLGPYNVYQKMDQWNWTDSLEAAFRKLYVTDQRR